ncbi:MAG TPA: cytochrome c [Xanthobacteraceae bacterium]|nr:cytochrome c [Xanthobacteraceae bacterium]
MSKQKNQILASFLMVLAYAVCPSMGAQAQSVDPADIAAGERLFHRDAHCQACHGWAGDGHKMDNQMPDGADLRASTLDRQNVITTIKCGRPGTDMPAFDKFAYSDGRCYGLKQADLTARQLTMFDPPATLAPNEIGYLADFLMAKVIGKGPMNHAQCVDFWGKEDETCADLPK